MFKKLLKIFSIIILNFLAVVVIFIVVDWFVYMNVHVKDYLPQDVKKEYPNRVSNNLPYNHNKKSIVTIGCSFVYGEGINEEDTFAYKLQQYTHRKVYNRGNTGEGVQHVLYQLQYADFFNKDKIVEPEYIIYVFINDHVRRMYSDIMYFEYEKYLKYKKVGNDLVLQNTKRNIFDFFKAAYITQQIYTSKFFAKDPAQSFELFDLYLLKSKEEIDKRYKNTKLVVFVYPESIVTYTPEKWNFLEKQGIKVVQLDETKYDYLSRKSYRARDGYHPSGKAWDVIVPLVAKELNLSK